MFEQRLQAPHPIYFRCRCVPTMSRTSDVESFTVTTLRLSFAYRLIWKL